MSIYEIRAELKLTGQSTAIQIELTKPMIMSEKEYKELLIKQNIDQLIKMSCIKIKEKS